MSARKVSRVCKMEQPLSCCNWHPLSECTCSGATEAADIPKLQIKMDNSPDRDGVLAALRELVAALDRRLPHVERMGEIQIAREAAALREAAAKRIDELAPDKIEQ